MSDQNKTVKNPGLVMAIRVMKQEFTSENQERVVREILKAKFLAPVRLEVMPFKVV